MNRREIARFRHAGLRVGASAVVHAVAVLDGEPMPACRQGYCPVGARLRPEREWPVSCRRCLRLTPAQLSAAEAYAPGAGAQVLPLEPAPPVPAVFPPSAA